MTVTVHCGDKIIKTEADVGAKLSNAVFNAVGVLPDMPCGGAGTCGKCRVQILNGDLNSSRSFYINDVEYNEGWRLACTSRIKEDVILYIK